MRKICWMGKAAAMTILACMLLVTNGIQAQSEVDTDDGVHVTTNSVAFDATFSAADKTLKLSSLAGKLESPELGAATGEHYNAVLQTIRAERPIEGASPGSVGITYDIIIQPGHYGRTTGHVGTSGHLVSERALNAYIVAGIARRLRDERLKILVVPADGSPRGLSAKIFLAIHADGSVVPCSTGPSIAYKRTSSLLPMHAIGFGLARAFGYDYEDFKRDNFTVDEHHYYMFDKVSAPLLAGLLEIGELTCARTEPRLIGSADAIANNVAAALTYIVRTQA